MSADLDDTGRFKSWATEMGCPLELMPSDDVLKRTFGTKNGQRLLGVCRRVAPVHQVQNVRTNVLLSKLRKYEENPGISTQGLSDDIQTLLRVRELRDKLKRIETNTAEKRERLDGLRECGAQLNQSYVKGLAQNRVQQANVNMLTAKLQSLDGALDKEHETSNTIASLIPVTLNPSVHSESQATSAVAETMSVIKDIYESESPSAAPIELNTTNHVWGRLTHSVKHVPNCLLWSSIRSMQNTNLEQIKHLSVESNQTKQLSNRHSFRDYLEQFLLKARSKHIGIELNRISVNLELEQSREQCIDLYETFYKHVHTHMEIAHDEYDSDRVEEYLAQFTTLYYNRGQLEFLQAEVLAKQKEYADRSTLNSHTALMSELQAVYAESDQKFHDIQEASAALYSIKEKMHSLEMTAKSLVFEARQSSVRALHTQHQSGRQQMNSSIALGGAGGGGGDSSLGSFNLSNNSVLCSTRLDGAADHSILMTSMIDNRNNACQSPSGTLPPNLQQPQQVNELNAYVESTLSAIIAHTSTMDTLQQLSFDNATHMHGLQTDLYGMRSICQTIQGMSAWNEILERFLGQQPRACSLPDFDEAALSERAIQLHNRLAELRDQCNQLIGACHQKNEMVQRLYDFLVDNSLRLFIPSAKTFNGRSYQDYEQEFLSLYSMVSDSEAARRN